ncbi:response regulator RpfG family c-di-GMP phosphodiesterase [Pseudoduganella flava]|uniref:Response regulator n=1 Tax=Pseudoduganella flava TaxID=871742 RepID=A0A562PJQ7_9BURK|nr:HD domain-containing phosphohydrolase [Pseudoduganella flava]QGZ42027.1 response regulator [Pseudoduganella flava]TWI44450.1 response regulator RpfG family c-di-GMP phosphodiesterase [Pseudoduganella flava]
MTPVAETPMPTLLCVDDEQNILSALRRLFRGKGYRVLTADSGAAGLQVLEQESVDLVISDMRMPEMDGARFLQQVRERWPDTLRLLLTGYSDIHSIMEAINRGEIYRYITKPWDDNDIQLVVRQALEQRALEQERQRLELLAQRQQAANDAQAAANRRLKQNFITTIKILSSIAELRGTNLTGQSRQMADLARKIATQMQMDSKEAQDVFVAALLHDIGKIGFSDDLLKTPLTLMNGTALGQYRKHPITAEQLLMPLEDLRGSAAILRAQLERFDGKGFPDGLSGFAIPLGARILALVADYYNLQQGGMVQRHLREPEARSLILDGSGTRYDPAVVTAFRQVFDADGGDALAGVEVLSGELVPGMVLARDLVSREGLMLLAADHVLDARMIRQVQDFETKSGMRLPIFVQRKGVP